MVQDHAGSYHCMMGKLQPWSDDAHGQKQYSDRLILSKGAWLILRGPVCGNKTFPTPLHHHLQAELLIRDRLGPWVQILNVAPENETPPASWHFIRPDLKLSSFGKPVPTVALESCSWLTRVKPDVVFCYCSPSASRWLSESEWLSESPQPSCQLKPVWPFTFNLSHHLYFHAVLQSANHITDLLWMFTHSSQWATVLCVETPCWWERSEENGQTLSSCQEGYSEILK